MDQMIVIKKAVRHYGGYSQVIKAMEELGELIQALAKYIGPVPEDGTEIMTIIDHVAEEAADVSIMLDQLRIILDNSELVDDWRYKKLVRLAERIESEEES